jgi:hypothetical protein
MDIKLGDLELKECDVDIILEKYTRRHYNEDTEGDDMVDISRKSYEFFIKGRIDLETFKLLDRETRKQGNVLDFEFGRFKIVIKRLQFKSSGEFICWAIEDVDTPKKETDGVLGVRFMV